jgi:metallophosphoesterase superfamily enzyme
MTEVEIRPGLRLNAGPSLFFESLRALVVADVHWGYATSQRAAGRLLPRWGDDDIAARLSALIAHYGPRVLIIAGDVVHGAPGADSAQAFFDGTPRDLQVVLVGGNHDRRASLPCVTSHYASDMFFHHGDEAMTVPPGALEIVGHHHPAATWHDGAGTSLKLPALVEGPRRLILPAFSPWAAGVAWNHRLLPRERLWFIAPRRIFSWQSG